MVEGYVVVVELLAIPKLARHLLVLLVKALAVVGVLAAPNAFSVAKAHLKKPVWVGDALPCGANNVGFARLQDCLSHLKGTDASSRNNGNRVARIV